MALIKIESLILGISVILFCQNANFCDGARLTRLCPSLSVLPGAVVSCNLPSENRTINCLDGGDPIPRGTIAVYKCEREKEFSVSFLKCRCKGKWNGLKIFNDFMQKCNISDYSLNGPSELNLSQREIRQLFGENEQLPASQDGFQEDCVAYHNFYRKIHHSPPLKLNSTLSEAAQKWADGEVDKPTLQTEDWTRRWYSQNLYRISNPGIDTKEAVRLAVAAWYQGAYKYDWNDPSSNSAFTQLVWRSTTDIGVGVSKSGNRTIVVVDYYPPGNVLIVNSNNSDKWALFKANVLPPNPDDTRLNSVTSSSTPSIITAETSTTPPILS